MDISISAVVTLLLPVPAFVAYRHPAAYRKVFGWLFMLASIVILALMLWDVGAASMYRAMRPFIDREKLVAAEKTANAIAFLDLKWIVAWMCLSGYLVFLAFLETFGIIAPDAAKKPPVSNEAGSQS